PHAAGRITRDALGQRLQRRTLQALDERGVIKEGEGVGPGAGTGQDSVVHYFTATIEAKLKHWNHTAKLAKPASRMRCSCARSVSGTNTFSIAARFLLISVLL